MSRFLLLLAAAIVFVPAPVQGEFATFTWPETRRQTTLPAPDTTTAKFQIVPGNTSTIDWIVNFSAADVGQVFVLDETTAPSYGVDWDRIAFWAARPNNIIWSGETVGPIINDPPPPAIDDGEGGFISTAWGFHDLHNIKLHVLEYHSETLGSLRRWQYTAEGDAHLVPVPEPSTMAAVSIGLCVSLLVARCRSMSRRRSPTRSRIHLWTIGVRPC